MPWPAALTSLPAPSTVLHAARPSTKPVNDCEGCEVFFRHAFAPCAKSESTDVDEVSGDRGRRRHCGTHQMRAAARALPALEIAVRRRRAALARLELVVVHREAHRASGLAPFEARRRGKSRSRPSASACAFTRPEPGTTIASFTLFGDVAAARDRRRLPQVLDARVGARADEHLVDADVGHQRVRLSPM